MSLLRPFAKCRVLRAAASCGQWRSLQMTKRGNSTVVEDGDVATLILLRHGQSTWNATPTFTGWCDPPLTSRGISEALAAGRLLTERGYSRIDRAFTSELQRASHTCELVLESVALSSPGPFRGISIPVETSWALNERHYGALQGLRKNEPSLVQQYGEEQLVRWRREFDAAPPEMDIGHMHYLPPPAPVTESLAACQKRVLDYWHGTIVPSLLPGGTVLVVAHSNTLRALLGHLDSVPAALMPNVHVPNSIPCIFRLAHSGNGDMWVPVSPLLDTAAGGSRGQWLFSAENHKRLRGKIGGSGSFTRAVFEAWDTNGDRELSLNEIENGLRQLMGGDDVAVAAVAAKILEEVDIDGSNTLDLEEFEAFAVRACRKFMPGLMEEV